MSSKPAHVQSRRQFYDDTATAIKISGIEQVIRDTVFDDLPQLRSAGIRLLYRALDVLCYAPTHTFVEKLQAISTKYRSLTHSTDLPKNFMRHYYDVYCLLAMDEVQSFIGTAAYEQRAALYYQGQPTFEEVLGRIRQHIHRL